MIPLSHTVPTAAEVRALLTAYRRRMRAETATITAALADDEPDATLIDLASAPFDSVDDVADRLRRIEAYLRDDGDRRSVFLTVYARMTATVATAMDEGTFADPEWVTAYLVAFAEYYRRALLAFERRRFDSLPEAWLLAFGAAERGETLVAQDALLGINAHINDDLTYTLRDVRIDPGRDAKRADHDRINEILARLTAVVQESLVEVYDAVGVRGIDALVDPFDDRVALLGLAGSRELAWRNAVLLADLPAWAAERYVDWRVRTVSTGAAAIVLAPRIDAEARQRIRRMEAGTDALSAFRDEFRRRTAAGVVSL
ncbi:hypothetical protein C461_01387 [Halorubrum aidingense JCM 13560]|uniref:Uncharacterized protein n=1 Tax=Halorubrum aidingense JCM 13560 TaxID=1230454 RepID=M0PN66_9EURY|nr:DUF5995 family protein [Halorubrum aidingense]EMA70250.1 hypothetical protein C461_01387 [Halorubrum aidingense JCM 13560]